MQPQKLYIQDFMCYEKAFIDFKEFKSALIVGKKDNNDMHSNGVGKSTIFNAIEYVLFNQSEFSLDKIIRDDTNSCKIVFDFSIEDQEYRLFRIRNKKGNTDLTLLKRNSVIGSDIEVYHNNANTPYTDKKDIEKFWKDISGSRAGDTEKDLTKLIKFNYKSFSSTVLFPLYDVAGLPTTTPEKRKGILKEAFNLIIYSKLEKIAKDRLNVISKEIDSNRILINSFGSPQQDLLDLNKQLENINNNLSIKNLDLDKLNLKLTANNDKLSRMISDHSDLESKFSNLLSQEKFLLSNISKLETSIKEYKSKKTNVLKVANDIIEEISTLKKQQLELIKLDYSQIDIDTEKNNELKEQIIQNNIIIKNSLESYEDLKIPMPSGTKCKNCRKPMTDQDRENHKEHIAKEMKEHLEAIDASKEIINTLNKKIIQNNLNINSLSLSKQQLETINTKISAKNKEVKDKKDLYEEYCAIFNKFTSELDVANKELALIKEDLQKSSISEANEIKAQIINEKKNIELLIASISILNKEISSINSDCAVIKYAINKKEEDKIQKDKLEKNHLELEKKMAMLPTVIQSFSTIGIPNLIIQNVLDDLQVEANNLLSQLKPGLQLSFAVEKTNGDGEQADTLDIKYFINGKERSYKQLGSKGMQLAVAFSLKLGLSFLLQKMTGAEIKLLLIDEVDQSLDKASVDAFADIIKFFQKDFTILVITHNDRMKDKFQNAILVEQNSNMISTAKVVSSW